MLTWIDNWLNQITMYRLVVWTLVAYLVIAVGYALFGVLPYSPWAILLSTGLIIGIGWGTNLIFARVWQAPVNAESWLISALILALIVSPLRSYHDLPFLFWAVVWTIASKFMVAVHRKHLFNPAAFGVAITGVALQQSATWWVGTLVLLPWVAIGGFLIVRKIRRADLAVSFLAAALATVTIASVLHGSSLTTAWRNLIVDSPLIFFATVMLTEPLTTPPSREQQSLYGGLTGLLFAPQFHLGTLFFTPEQALLAGNVVAWLMSPKARLLLTLKERLQLAPDIVDFVFVADRPLAYSAGQYLEWTLPHEPRDGRGNRRYFTLASAPSESTLRIGVKFYPNSSSFKMALRALAPGDQLVASQLAGDFTLPRDTSQKLVFVAGGIGVTPFRSMVQELNHRQERRDIVVLYAAKTSDQLVYRDVFDTAQALGVKPVYVVSDPAAAQTAGWTGLTGKIDAGFIQATVPDFRDRTFYLSGPHGMVTAFEATLGQLGVPHHQIKVDYFPGFA